MITELKTQIIKPRMARNKSELDKFLVKNNVRSLFPAIADQLSSVVVSGLEDGAYNGSIIRYNGKLVMAYRFHPEKNSDTRIGICELSESCEVVHNEILNINDENSVEDPKLWQQGNSLFLSYVSSTWPTFPACSVKYVELSKPDHWRANLPKDIVYKDRQTMEKNFVPFQSEGRTCILYRSAPKQIVFDIETGEEFVTDSLRWPYGEIRGGCVIPWNGNLLRFFHSSLRNEAPPTPWRYFCGALLMEAKPPFKMIAVSRRPVLYGSEIGGDESVHHFKKNIIFPGGAVATDNGWLVSAGVNDTQCVLVKLTEKDLNL